MGMVTGQGASLQIGKESSWGTKATANTAINFTSEDFKFIVDRTEEDSLIGFATSSAMDIQKKSVTFGWEQLAKPENIGLVLALALGTEGNATQVSGKTGVYTHAFTMLQPGASASLPKFTAVVDRHVAVKGYTGCKIGSLNFKCAAGDYLRLSVNGVGKDEVAATKNASLTIPSLKAFCFAGGKVSFDGTEYADITNVDFSLDNSLDDGEQTTGSGYYGTEPEPQKRNVSITLDTKYNTNSETIRENKYKTASEVSCSLVFESPSFVDSGNTVNYSIQIDLPHLVITDCNPNITGPEKIKLSISGKACETASDEAVTITLTDSKTTKYLA